MTTLERSETSPPDATPGTGRAASGTLLALIQEHQRAVWRHLRLLGADANEADDLMQETFVRFARGQGAAGSVVATLAFLRGIARNLLLESRRKANRQGPGRDWSAAVDALAAAEPEALTDDRIDALRACLERVTERARQALELHHVDGLSSRETGERLGLRDEGIKSLLARTRDVLRECVERRLQGDGR